MQGSLKMKVSTNLISLYVAFNICISQHSQANHEGSLEVSREDIPVQLCDYPIFYYSSAHILIQEPGINFGEGMDVDGCMHGIYAVT